METTHKTHSIYTDYISGLTTPITLMKHKPRLFLTINNRFVEKKYICTTQHLNK